MKERLVGGLNMFFGLIGFYFVAFFAVTLSRPNNSIVQLEVENTNALLAYGVLLLFVVLSLGNLFVGMKLFSESRKQYYLYGVALLIASVFLSWAYFKIAAASVVLPYAEFSALN